MDFWSRLIAGTALSPAQNSKAAANNPEKRLARFKKDYSQLLNGQLLSGPLQSSRRKTNQKLTVVLLNAWRSYSDLSKDQDAAELVRNVLQELTTTLSDESRRPLPHPCISFAASKQIYVPIGKIAATSYNEGIIREGVALFATLLDSEEEDFVENDNFATSLMNLLVRITGVNSIRLGRETEVEIVELSFNITTKIRLDPEILPVWFKAQEREESPADSEDEHEKFTGKTQRDDFPLFYLLIDYIHDEGRIGDFARTGLLYIIEAASNSVALEQWIVESDLATMMATGLGALYSQLSRKLVIDHPPDELPPILALSDYEHPVTTSEIVSSVDFNFQSHMETFLAHLVFWQDVLNHCTSLEVKQTLLEHFQVIFLQQLLYPSLLESSDVDGGSSVAVITYLRRILEALDHPDMIHLILHYLLALPDTKAATDESPTVVSAARKRKSMDLATIMAKQLEDSSTPALYNLVDLIRGCLTSENQQTISVTLQLLSTILRRHHRYAVTTLLSTSHIVSEVPLRTVGGHEKEMDFFLGLAGALGTEDDFDEVYDNHVRDCMSALESHPCSISLVAPKVSGTSKIPAAQATIAGAPRDIRAHTLRPEDLVFKTLLSVLSTFFTNSVETNLSLTGTIVDLATCGYMRLDGWLLPDPSQYKYHVDEEVGEEEDEPSLTSVDSIEREEKAQMRALRNNRRVPVWDESKIPAILRQLQKLVDQVAGYRDEIPRFDDLLQRRREAFQATSTTGPGPVTTVHQPPPRSSLDTPSRSRSPPRSAIESLAQRMLDRIDTPSRSRSPRGRSSQEQQRTSASSSNAIQTPSTSISRGGPAPPQFPMGLETPSRGSSRAISASPLRMGTSHVPDSQVRAFEAIDQSLLSRRVGIPSPKSEDKAIPFRLQSMMQATEQSGPDEENIEEGSVDRTHDYLQDSQEDEKVEKLSSVSHVLTNVLVLQEFLIELAALVQVRGSLFGEIRFV